MGGAFFVPIGALVGCAAAASLPGPGHLAPALAVAAASLGYAAIGALDDVMSLTGAGKGRGASPGLKLGLQLAVAAAFSAGVALVPGLGGCQ